MNLPWRTNTTASKSWLQNRQTKIFAPIRSTTMQLKLHFITTSFRLRLQHFDDIDYGFIFLWMLSIDAVPNKVFHYASNLWHLRNNLSCLLLMNRQNQSCPKENSLGHPASKTFLWHEPMTFGRSNLNFASTTPHLCGSFLQWAVFLISSILPINNSPVLKKITLGNDSDNSFLANPRTFGQSFRSSLNLGSKISLSSFGMHHPSATKKTSLSIGLQERFCAKKIHGFTRLPSLFGPPWYLRLSSHSSSKNLIQHLNDFTNNHFWQYKIRYND